jgi:hypothetical protein
LNYSVKTTNGVTKISQVDPSVFFYWIKVDAVAGANSFTVDQDITSGNFGTYFAKTAGQHALDIELHEGELGVDHTVRLPHKW